MKGKVIYMAEKGPSADSDVGSLVEADTKVMD
jgi:hypothetical protein